MKTYIGVKIIKADAFGISTRPVPKPEKIQIVSLPKTGPNYVRKEKI